jgi:hypothetical protein
LAEAAGMDDAKTRTVAAIRTTPVSSGPAPVINLGFNIPLPAGKQPWARVGIRCTKISSPLSPN